MTLISGKDILQSLKNPTRMLRKAYRTISRESWYKVPEEYLNAFDSLGEIRF